MTIKREGVLEPVMIDQGKAGAIDETEIFVVVAYEDGLCRLLDPFCDTKCFDACLIEALHKLNCGTVAGLKTDERVSFAKNEIRCY